MSVGLIVIIMSIITLWPEIKAGLSMMVMVQFLLTIFGLPIAAIASLFIGGGVWKFFEDRIANKRLRASLAGGVTGAVIMTFLVTNTFKSGPIQSFITIAACFALGFWCGWAGEKLANRN